MIPDMNTNEDDVIHLQRFLDLALEDVTAPLYYFWLGKEALYV